MAGLAALLVGTPVAAQGLLPASGVDVRTGDLRSQLERAYQAGPPITTPGWTITPSIDVAGAWGNPVQGAGGGVASARLGGDVYTIVTPGLSVFGQSQRLQGGLFLTPEFRAYATKGKLNSFNNNFAGQAHAILLQDTLFLDFTGASASQSRNGGLSSSSSLSRSDSVQSTTFRIAPSAQHQFGDYGIARIGTALSRTMTDAQGNTISTSPFSGPISNAPLTTKQANASFRTGDILGQTAAELHSAISQRDGGGALRNSSRSSTALDLERFIDRQWTLLTSVGVEDIRYSGLSPIHHNNATWSGGLRWVPNNDSAITLTYGRHDGGTSLSFDGHYAPTSRIRISAAYSEGISSGLEDGQNAIGGAAINRTGQLINPLTGLPIGAGNNYFGTQTNSAYRYKRASATASLVYDRDVFSLSLRQDDQTMLSASTVGEPSGMSGGYATVSVQHDLNPAMSTSGFAEIGQRKTPGRQGGGALGAATQDTLSLGATFTIVLSETLTGRLQYTFTRTSSATASLNQTQNLALVGLHKTF